MVTIILIEPRSEDVIRKTMPRIQKVCPVVAITARGGYDVQPELAAPPGKKKLTSIIMPPTK
jgi:hypothetical protein